MSRNSTKSNIGFKQKNLNSKTLMTICMVCVTVPEQIDAGYCLVSGCRVVQFLVKNTGGAASFCIMARELWPASNFKVRSSPSLV